MIMWYCSCCKSMLLFAITIFVWCVVPVLVISSSCEGLPCISAKTECECLGSKISLWNTVKSFRGYDFMPHSPLLPPPPPPHPPPCLPSLRTPHPPLTWTPLPLPLSPQLASIVVSTKEQILFIVFKLWFLSDQIGYNGVFSCAYRVQEIDKWAWYFSGSVYQTTNTVF